MESKTVPDETAVIDQIELQVEGKTVQPAVQSKDGFMHYHLLFSGIYFASKRLEKLWTLVSTIQVEALVLGLCYSFWDDSSDHASSANDVFGSYAGMGLTYVVIALVIGGLFCGAVQALGMHLPIAGVSGALALGGVIYLNVEQCCYSEGSRWGVSLLWTVLLQLFVLETAKAGVQLLWSRKRANTN